MIKADMVVKDVYVYNTFFRRFEHADVYLKQGKFLYIDRKAVAETMAESTGRKTNRTGEGQELIAETTKVIEGQSSYMIPGLIDIHMHIESSMTTPYQFSNQVIQYGVTTLVSDPHEMVNVFGVEGITDLMRCDTVVDIFYGIPSSVPSTNQQLETTGGTIQPLEVQRLLRKPNIVCLGEVMNYKELVSEEETAIKQIVELVEQHKPRLMIEGHCPNILDLDLARFIYAGVTSDHTQQTIQSMVQKISNGMFLEIQEKSMTKQNIDFLVRNQLYEYFCLVTDDVMPDKLIKGHLNLLLKKAIHLGMPPEQAIYVCTYTPARRMNMVDRGVIAPGKIADFILLENIMDWSVRQVYKKGEPVYDGQANYRQSSGKIKFAKKYYQSIHLKPLTEEAFRVEVGQEYGQYWVKARIMQVNSETTFTRSDQAVLAVKNGYLEWENSEYALICVFNRHSKTTNNQAYGLVGGSVQKGAVATSYAHDHHNLMVMGKNLEDMMLAANWVIEHQGGICVVEAGQILASTCLPLAGILSDQPLAKLAAEVSKIIEQLVQLGLEHANPIMSFCTHSLPASPELKITDKGLIDVYKMEVVGLLVAE